MKRIIIVNNNMNVGGVQKALYNLLWAIHDRYDVTLFLFSDTGAYMDQLPPDVKIQTCGSLFRYLGVSQGACTGADRLKRGTLAALTKFFGRDAVMPLLLASQPRLPDHYDCAIAYLQNGRASNFYGGVQEFVLHRINADKKVAFLHCDYRNCDSNYKENNRTLARFDVIAACSDGCRRALVEVLPELAEKTVTVRNCHRHEQIRHLANQDPVEYEADAVNVLMVSRLSHEKGIERAIIAAANAAEQGIPIMLHIVGGGPMRSMLEKTAAEYGIMERVCFHGEQANPYRYMTHADLLLMSSFHEAAPMVIDEALCLNLPVLTVRTTSSHEMVTMRNGGWVCGNSGEELTQALIRVLSKRGALRSVRVAFCGCSENNDNAMEQFEKLIEG